MCTNSDDQFKTSRSIMDPIHGMIQLTDFEMKVIEHRLFQRLHFMRQLSLTYQVYPGATHTRFAHSLGVMHMGNQILEHCIKNTNKYQGRPQEPLTNQADFKLFDLDKDKCMYMKILKNFRLACLLHDIGHGPLSHSFDKFAIKRDRLEEILENYQSHIEKSKDNNDVEHETMSEIFIATILDDLKKENDEWDKDIDRDCILKFLIPAYI